MIHIEPDMVAEAINQLGNEFDAHDVEKRVIRNHPVAVSREIIRFDGKGDVLQIFSAQFARCLDKSFEHQIQKTSKVRTENLGGLVSECQQWKKLKCPVVVGEKFQE